MFDCVLPHSECQKLECSITRDGRLNMSQCPVFGRPYAVDCGVLVLHLRGFSTGLFAPSFQSTRALGLPARHHPQSGALPMAHE